MKPKKIHAPKQTSSKKTKSVPSMKQRILSCLSETPTKSLNYKQIARKMGIINPIQRAWIASLLGEMTQEKLIQEVKVGSYRIFSSEREILCTLVKKSGGFYIITDDKGNEHTVTAPEELLPLPGDRVRVKLSGARSRGGISGKIVRIDEHARDSFVGKVLRISQHNAVIQAGERSSLFEVVVPLDQLKGAQENDKVLVKITFWGTGSRKSTGEVLHLLGKAGENNTEMHAILASYGLPMSYPQEAEKEAEKLEDKIDEEELRRREDLREVFTITIDPDDAKDFDDALSLRELSNGNLEVGVHIADVSYFVTPGSAIDAEAYSRATSIYLVDRTIPMLPEKLCNDLCSLKPKVDRYAYSCIFEMTPEAEVVKYRIGRSVIHSNARLTYNDAQKMIEGGSTDTYSEILTLHSLATLLRKRRFENGAIQFHSREVKFQLDETGKPIGVTPYETKESNHLVEEFMLLANRTVAQEIGGRKNPPAPTFVYRVHNSPDPERIEQLAQFVSTLGYKLKSSSENGISSQSLNHLLDEISGTQQENIISVLMVRSLARAVYSTHNIGHYGLGFEFYTHFTSPIRRYPDLMVHRLLSHYAQGEKSVNPEEYEEYCKHCSEQEQIASDAERDSIKYKQVEYMSQFIGKYFDGIISGITEWGIYVELTESMCTGMIPMRNLGDEYFEVDNKNHCVIGRKSKKRYTLGESVTVQVAGCNLEQRQLDFNLA